MIVKLDEGALKAAGWPDSIIQTMRHIVAQVGTVKFETTLPEVASMTDSLTPVVAGLTITVSATNVKVSELEATQADLPLSDNHLVRRLDDLQADAERISLEYAALNKAISEVRDEIGALTDPASVLADFRKTTSGINTGDETTATIKTKLGITTLSGSNTGDQTLASLGAAAVAGSSTQDFACKILTASADAVINSAKIGKSGTANFYVDADNTAVRAFSAAAGAGIYFQNSAGAATWAVVTVLGVTVTAGFGCNGKTAQTAFALGAAATDLPTVITLANNLRTMAINNGMGS